MDAQIKLRFHIVDGIILVSRASNSTIGDSTQQRDLTQQRVLELN